MKSDYEKKQKTVILDYLKNRSDEHITAAGIVTGLKANGESIGTATVYRRLDKLVNTGEVKKYITDKVACYQYTGNECRNHFHLKCTKCDTLLHIDCDFLSGLAPHIQEHHKFKVDNFRTIMYGLCEKCVEE